MDRVKAGFTLTNEVRPLAALTLLTELSTHAFRMVLFPLEERHIWVLQKKHQEHEDDKMMTFDEVMLG